MLMQKKNIILETQQEVASSGQRDGTTRILHIDICIDLDSRLMTGMQISIFLCDGKFSSISNEKFLPHFLRWFFSPPQNNVALNYERFFALK